MKYRDVVNKIFKPNGYKLVRVKGSHETWRNEKTGKSYTFSSNPTKSGGSEFGPPIISKIKKNLGIK